MEFTLVPALLASVVKNYPRSRPIIFCIIGYEFLSSLSLENTVHIIAHAWGLRDVSQTIK